VLTRGEKLVEILKQGQYVPMPVEEQIMIIHAGTSGGLDDFPARRVQEFEKAFLRYMKDNSPEVATEIRTTKAVSDKAKAALDKAVAAVKAELVAAAPAAAAPSAKKK
jgi:F-type H+-transporting ATPase subunit alpha